MIKNLKFTLTILTFFLIIPVQSQNMIGLTKSEVQKQMTLNYSKFSASSFGNSTNISTLRYIDKKTDRTLIFYFNKENKCKYSKMIEDMNLLQSRIKEFNIKYKPNGELKWVESIKGKKYNIKIEKEKYIYNVLITE